MTDYRLLLLMPLLTLAACGATPVEDRYYSLVLAGDAATAAQPAEAGGIHLVVGPVQLPDYLQRRGIATELAGNEIRTANHNFWAEPLDDAIAKVLARDLARLNGNLTVDREAGRWTGDGDCRLRIEFDRFHATTAAEVVSSGRYWLGAGGGTVRQEFAVTRTLSGDGYAQAVEALRDTLATIAGQVSELLASRHPCGN